MLALHTITRHVWNAFANAVNSTLSSSSSGESESEVSVSIGDGQAQSYKKVVPNEEHQDKIKEQIGELEDQGHTHVAGGDKKEKTVRTPGGNKESRRPDITTIGPDGKPYRENVGRQNQDGTPVSRERKALEDIQDATGQCAFTPYNC
ncbi:MAG: type secretion protein Rhs [Gammaproteobacteria bacterium]|nr:type secretion protein Rhs [Gammaproteobacteria bacterium]